MSQRIVITGGAGRLAQAVLDELLPRGDQILAVDCVRPEKLRCRFVQADLSQPAAVYDVLQGADAVIHLAAIPGPQQQPSSTTFLNNVTSTYHVVEAAAALGVKRFVNASSLFALGWVEQAELYWPDELPVTESHPLTPFEGYGLSKQVGEEICAAACRRTGMSAVSLRFTNIVAPEKYFAFPWPAPTRERGLRFVMWAYLDLRDAARACCLSLSADITGHEAFYIAADDTRFDVPTVELLQDLAPATLRIIHPLPEFGSVLSCEKARQLLDFSPQYHWRDCKTV